ncbi:M23 family metallopeptidase [Geopsychrobacter electrodiphilus]|uniref:M23 family metallopeptidase n=1 Tax=Geopsychrobacter electrodiphilus TaxID=225196 RepID=UPI0003A6AF22|nr:M23 family metallopeptidase [Geopsychrobacter electrodiphilus]
MNYTSRCFRQMGMLFSQYLLIVVLVLLLNGCVGQGVYHQVAPGQTLYRISKTYGVDEAYLARINGISNPSQLRIGTRIFIPGASQSKYVPATVSASVKPVKIVKADIIGPNKESPALDETSTSSISVTKPSTLTLPRDLNPIKTNKVKIKLHWPLRGKILRAFGVPGKGGGKGLEIAAREGSMVRAAAAGKVIYSGNGVQGFGHLMILQHENDFFTVYGFNSKNYVSQGQFVSQGERIASSGRPPNGESGRLHFEVRIGKHAVDPILYLP